MRTQDWIFVGKLAEFDLQYSAQDLLIDEKLCDEYIKKRDRLANFWKFICYHTPLWRFVKV
jgi:hypothetical protein